MSLPWYPFYPGDYASDTSDLSCCEHGCYRLLLDAFWSRGPLPDDLNRLQRLSANCDAETLRFILERYWDRTERGWVNAKMEEIRKEQSAKHQRRVNAGRRGGLQKSENKGVSSNARAMLEQCSSNQNQNQNQKEETMPSSGELDPGPPKVRKGSSDAHKEAAELLEYLNTKAGRSYRAKDNSGKWSPHVEQAKARIAEYGVDAIKAVIDRKVAEWSSDEKMARYLRPDTLFNRTKLANYIGDAESKSSPSRSCVTYF